MKKTYRDMIIAYQKIVKVVESCQTNEQVCMTERIISQFERYFGDTINNERWDLTWKLIPIRNKIHANHQKS